MRSILRTVLQLTVNRQRYTYHIRYIGAGEGNIRLWMRIIVFFFIFLAIASICGWWSSNVFPFGVLIGYNQDLEYVGVVILAIISWFIARIIVLNFSYCK